MSDLTKKMKLEMLYHKESFIGDMYKGLRIYNELYPPGIFYDYGEEDKL